MQQAAYAGFVPAKLRKPQCGDFVECSQYKWVVSIHFRTMGQQFRNLSPCAAAGCRLPGRPAGCSVRQFLAITGPSRDQLDDNTDSPSSFPFKNSKLDGSTQRRVVDFGSIGESHFGAHAGAGLHRFAGESHAQVAPIANAKVRPIRVDEDGGSLPPANSCIYKLNNHLCAWHPSRRVLSVKNKPELIDQSNPPQGAAGLALCWIRPCTHQSRICC